jgi:hypothetical protein
VVDTYVTGTTVSGNDALLAHAHVPAFCHPLECDVNAAVVDPTPEIIALKSLARLSYGRLASD